MHEDAISALKEHNVDLADDVIKMDDEVDRFNFYITRQLKHAVQSERAIKEIGLSNARECLGYRLIAKSVERIADHAVKIAESVSYFKASFDPRIFEKVYAMSSFAKSAFNDAVTSLFKRDYALAEGAISRGERVDEMVNDVLKLFAKGIEVEERGNFRLILESVRRTVEYASDIAEVVLNLTIEKIIRT